MTRHDSKEISRALSHALRHEPELYGLRLDPDGWIEVEQVLTALRRRMPAWADLSPADLHDIVYGAAKQRHEIRDGRVRALYGHSVPLAAAPAASPPPAALYHGTATDLVPAILREGLLPMARQFVHLSESPGEALLVARRKSRRTTIFAVRAADAHASGLRFMHPGGPIWMADAIPPAFLRVLD